MAAIIVASIQPLEMQSYLLHQTGTLFMIGMLIFCLYKIGLSFLSFNLYILFLFIHIVAAHYLYSYVPYNDWIQTLFGFDLNALIGWSRNMFDRFVHLVLACCSILFLSTISGLVTPAKPFTIFLLVIQFVMATSLIYEWIEWLIAIGLSPEQAESYNGQQGDMWDAHKDILLATVGAMFTGGLIIQQIKSPLK